MIDYVDEIVAAYDKVLSKLDDGFSAVKKKSKPARTSAAPDDLFVVNNDAEKLSEEGSTAFHNLVAKTLYVSSQCHQLGARTQNPHSMGTQGFHKGGAPSMHPQSVA